MGRQLHAAFPVFAQAFDTVVAELDQYLDHPLTDVVWGQDADLFERTEWAQTALFAFEVALFRLLESYGFDPDYVLAHSVGETAAAYVAGVLSLSDACRLFVTRARMMAAVPAGGVMIAIEATEEEVLPLLTETVSIAAVNTPRSVVISGDDVPVNAIAEVFTGRGRKIHRLRVSHGFHSSHMDPMLAELEELVETVAIHEPRIPVVSSVTGEQVSIEQLRSPSYWIASVRETVRFAQAVRWLDRRGATTLVEIGPDALTAAMAQQSCGEDVTVVSPLRREWDDDRAVVNALATLCVSGLAVDWTSFFPGAGYVDLPTPAPGEDAQPVDGRSLMGLVCACASAVLGTDVPLAADQSFFEAGFDSVTALALRNHLAAETGRSLPATLIYDYPTAAQVVEFLTGDTARPVQAARTASDEPIAIVGMACRLPGGVVGPDGLWGLVADGVDAVGDFPVDRGWDLAGLAGSSATLQGGFLDGVANFDAGFFGISPREALAMDPQQRLVLETSWEALEHARIDPKSLSGSPTGVFLGGYQSNYDTTVGQSDADLRGAVLTGVAGSVASGRVAYSLGLEGPAVTVDTACSSALVAMHLASQALRAGECSLALAGGVTVMAEPDFFVGFSQLGGLSADGRCKAFSDSADGTGWSEGVGMVVLERLSDARRHGHRVLAVVRGSAVNQDGASNGLTAPNGPSQQRVIRQALASAGLSPGDVDVVEAHGTGTTLGDPIEAQAVLATYGQDRETPVWLGSLKSNIGHTQAAAGVAGVIKMVMAMRHGTLPATLHVDTPTTHVDWTWGNVSLLTEPVAWPETDRPRRAGVSAFGVSGTNAHVILEAPPAEKPSASSADKPATDEPATTDVEGVVAWVVSAKTAEGLRAQAGRLLGLDAGVPVADVALSLLTRSAFEHRAVIVGSDRAELDAGLHALAEGVPSPLVVEGTAAAGAGVGFVFPGQGAQWVGMGRELLATCPVFAQRLDECEAVLRPWVDWSVREVLAGAVGAPGLERVDVVQPVSWAVMVSLAAVWEWLGVVPDVVVGHSQGEIAAVCVAGGLSLADGARVVALRSQAIAEVLAGQGGMVALPVSVEQAGQLIACWAGRVSIAAVNGPDSVVVSGDTAAITELLEQVPNARRIAVDYASHSAQVELLHDQLLEQLAPITPNTSTIPVVSAVTGELADTADWDAGYWYRNLRETVRFDTAIHTAIDTVGVSTLVEVSAHPVLIPALADTPDLHTTGTLRRDNGGLQRLLLSAAHLHTTGTPINWTPLYPEAHTTDLPTYPFQHQRYWPRPGSNVADVAAAGLTAVEHPLLRALVQLPESGEVVFTSRLSVRTHPWLADHIVQGLVVFPGTGFVELLIRAGDTLGCNRLVELVLETPLVVPEHGVQVQAVVDRDHAFAVYARHDEDDSWTRHATGRLDNTDTAAPQAEGGVWPAAGAVPVETAGMYAGLAAAGFGYGPVFAGLSAAWSCDGDVLAEVGLPDGEEAGGFGIHPGLLDAVLHASVFAGLDETDTGRLPFSFTDVVLHASGAHRVRARLHATGPEQIALTVTDEHGLPVLTATVVLRPLIPGTLTATTHDSAVLALDWTDITPNTTEPGAGLGEWVVVGASGPVTELGEVETAPAVAVLTVAGDPARVVESAHELTTWVLRQLQTWLTEERFTHTRLVVHTHNAVGITDQDGPVDVAAAAVWGLARSAQSENPGRIVLLDHDSLDMSSGLALDVEQALATGEPQLAIRAGRFYAPRLIRVRPTDTGVGVGDGTVLITGGSGGLAGVLARHLVTAHGVGQLVLASRRGLAAPGAAELVADLTALGARVSVEACDVTDRDALAGLLDRYPVTGIVHINAVLDDGVIGPLTPDRMAAVLGPKVDAAWHLHDLTRDHNLALFVVFSSLSGILGGPGQGNYAAGNAFLDALMAERRQEGLPGVSMAWTTEVGLTGTLSETDLRQMNRAGMPAMPVEQGLHLFDQALHTDHAVVRLTRLNLPALRIRQPAPAILHTPAGTTTRRAVAGDQPAAGGFTARMAGLSTQDRERALLDLVRDHAAAVLGYTTGHQITTTQPFRDMGFDSLTAVELRNRLTTTTGLTLPATLVFDYVDLLGLAKHLETNLTSVAAVQESTSTGGQDLVGDLYIDAVGRGKMQDVQGFLTEGAKLRAKFDLGEQRSMPPVGLSPGHGGPHLICVCPPVWVFNGPYIYLRLAAGFGGRRQVSAIMPPGFAAGERLPATREVMVAAMADAIQEYVGVEQYSLTGLSSAGALAYEIGKELERRGSSGLSGVVLLDTYRLDDEVIGRWQNDIGSALLEKRQLSDGIGFDKLTAATWVCATLLSDWRPAGLSAPALLVRADTPLVPEPGDVRWQTDLTDMSAVVDVDGNHFTMIEGDHVQATAAVVDAWLTEVSDRS